MVQFVAPIVKANHCTETFNQMVKEFRNMAKKSGSKEIFDFVNSWTDSKCVESTLLFWTDSGSDDSDWQDFSENSEEEN